MSSRFVKITCAAALALPLAAVAMPSAHAQDFPAENDCNHHYSGAVTGNPHQSDGCYGIDQRIHHDGPSGDAYRGTTIVVQDGKGTVHCNPGDLFTGIWYSLPDQHEAWRSRHDLESVSGVDIIPTGSGVPNGASGDLSSFDGASVTAQCEDTA